MILTRKEMAELLNVSNKYLCPSNFEHIKGGAKKKGYNLISMNGRGEKTLFELKEEQEIEGEIWKNFPLSPNYQISNFGRVKHPSGGILTGTNSRGYIRTRIEGFGQIPNHRLVMLTFNPIENPENFVVDHINGIKSDNRVENLRWVWQSENIQFSDKNNTEIKEIIAKLIIKYGYFETKQLLFELLDD